MTALTNRVLHFPIIRIILGIVICFSLFIGIQNFVLKPVFYELSQEKDTADAIIYFLSIIVLTLAYYTFYYFLDKQKTSGLSVQLFSKELIGGFTLGFGAISLSILILYLLGYYHILNFSTDHYSIRLFALLLLAAFIEDLFFRGIVVRECENWVGSNITIAIGMVFEMDHLFNPNLTVFDTLDILIWGFTISILYIYSKRIWLPFFFHVGWNFSQPFYGSNLTGLNDMGSIIQSQFNGPQFLTGGLVGIEGSIFTTLILLSIGIVFYAMAKKEGKIIKRKRTK